MSGTVAISPEVRWSATGWIFDWVVEYLADQVTDTEVTASLHEIVNENLGWLGLDDHGPAVKKELLTILRTQLVAHAEAKLPYTIPDRPSAIDVLRELADKAAG